MFEFVTFSLPLSLPPSFSLSLSHNLSLNLPPSKTIHYSFRHIFHLRILTPAFELPHSFFIWDNFFLQRYESCFLIHYLRSQILFLTYHSFNSSYISNSTHCVGHENPSQQMTLMMTSLMQMIMMAMITMLVLLTW